MLIYPINPASADLEVESDHTTIRVNVSATSTQLMAGNTARKSLAFYNYSDKPAYISTNNEAATVASAITPNFKYVIPPNYALTVSGTIPTNSLQIIWENGASGYLVATEGF